TLERPVEVNVVINEPFDEQYENKESPQYKEFVGNFTKKMNPYYEGRIPNFKEVKVTNPRSFFRQVVRKPHGRDEIII
ncbi:hypothetical protein INR49_005972, partial [Caranx melampygus]